MLRDWWHSDTVDFDVAQREAAFLLFGYRATFQLPLNKVTIGVRSMVKRESPTLQAAGAKLPVGQRLKRTPQIVYKLERHPKMALARMQDIGGCRAILPGGEPEVRRVLRRIRKNWTVKHVKDYIAEPAESGYRGIHAVVLRDDRLIEIQLRTPRQHEWAEAIERTGFRTGHRLKDGGGPTDLLEYFTIAAHGIALEERNEVPDPAFMGRFEEARERVRPYFERR